MNATKTAAKGLLGFAIERRDHSRRSNSWLRGVRYFEETAPEDRQPGIPVGSDEAPIQSFFWGDYTAQPGRTYTYRVHPVYGARSRRR